MLGIAVASLGLMPAGFTMSGLACIVGILFFSS